MKTLFFKMVIFACIATDGMTSCENISSMEQKTQNLEKAKANLDDANIELEQARRDSTEYSNYKVDSEMKLKRNEFLIADLKDKMSTEGIDKNEKYNLKLDSFAQRNSKLRHSIQLYSQYGTDNWAKYKQKFSLEMDDLGKSISEVAQNNMKRNDKSVVLH